MATIRAEEGRRETTYEYDTGRLYGPRRRLRFKTRIEARDYDESIQKEIKLYGRSLLLLDPLERAILAKVLGEMKEEGVKIQDLWDRYKMEMRDDSPHLLAAMREFMQAQKAKNLRPSYLENQEIYLTKFISGRERDRVGTITQAILEEWMSQHTNPSTFRGRWGLLSSFFSYLVNKGYIRQNHMLKIPVPRIELAAPKILAVEEVERLLKTAKETDEVFLPYFLIGIYCGLRPEEIMRLNADDFRWVDKPGKSRVIVRSEVSKTRKRRIVRIPKVVDHWRPLIEDWAIPGRTTNFRRRFDDVRKRAKVEWSKDVMRHTAASIMVANFQSAEKAALELGHSTQTLMTHYREIMTKKDAKEYLALRP